MKLHHYFYVPGKQPGKSSVLFLFILLGVIVVAMTLILGYYINAIFS